MPDVNSPIGRRPVPALPLASNLGVLIPEIARPGLELAPEFYASSTDLSRLTWDRSGRPLGERWLPAEFTSEVEFDRRRCPYRGARQDLLMNVSPLGDIGSNWTRVLGLITSLSDAYLAVLEQDSHTWISLWELSKIACAIPFGCGSRGVRIGSGGKIGLLIVVEVVAA